MAMAMLSDLFRRRPAERVAPGLSGDGAGWAEPLIAAPRAPLVSSADGRVLVWAVAGDPSTATITEQFGAKAETYHRRYAAADHFEHLFRHAMAATGLAVPERPLILDLGSGSGVNSVTPCRRLFPGARIVATDLSAELLGMLAADLAAEGGAEDVVCMKMDAMSEHVAKEAFDLVTGAAILHHLDRPEQAVAAAGRALKPGGTAIFFEPFHGWSIMRLAFQRVLAEAALRKAGLDPDAERALHALIKDVRLRSRLKEREGHEFADLDDKWLFSRQRMEKFAAAAGFSDVRITPHNDHATLYRDTAMVHLRLSSGRSDLTLPDWALAIIDEFDAAMNLQAKRELPLEATVVLTK
jgi:SAM-dependent methyltransferase